MFNKLKLIFNIRYYKLRNTLLNIVKTILNLKKYMLNDKLIVTKCKHAYEQGVEVFFETNETYCIYKEIFYFDTTYHQDEFIVCLDSYLHRKSNPDFNNSRYHLIAENIYL